jgi:hypothetical protein
MGDTSSEVSAFPVITFIPRKAVIADELRAAAASNQGTEYFQSFHLGTLVNYGQPLIAYEETLRVLGQCRKADLMSFETIHKGGAYYWLGYASFLVYDFETAVYFMDAAVAEDLRRPVCQDNTPALLFIRLVGEDPNQAARGPVLIAESRMKELISIYNTHQGRPSTCTDLSIDELRSIFLSEAISQDHLKWRSLATALISYVLEYDLRLQQLNLVTQHITNEPFIFHLFKGCLLLESLLKENPCKEPRGGDLHHFISSLSYELGIPNNIKTSAASLGVVLKQLENADMSIAKSIELAAKTRNTTGHSLSWNIHFSTDQYRALYERIGSACLHTIASLYRTYIA